MDFRRFPESNTRQLISYDRFLSLTGEKVFLCLDRGVMEICRYLMNSRGLWRTTYVKQYIGLVGYNMPTEEEFEAVIHAIAEANEDMASCDDIVQALEGIRSAIEVSGSSSGCGCVGSGDDDVTEVNDNPTTPIPDDSQWEELGFASEEAYTSHKCDAIQFILVNYIQTLRNWAGLFGTVGGLTLAVITGLLLLTVPPAGLMLIVAAMGIMVGIDIGLLALLNDIADELNTNIDDIRCDMFGAGTTAIARDILRSAAQTAVEALVLGPIVEPVFLQITNNLISNEQLEIMFDPGASTGDISGTDCTGCGCTTAFFVAGGTWGTGDLTGTTWELTGVLIGGVYRLAVCACNQPMTFVSATGYTAMPSAPGEDDAVGISSDRCGEGLGEYDLWLDDDFPTGESFDVVGQFTINSSTEHTVTITIG